MAGLSLLALVTSSCGGSLESLPADTRATAFVSILPEERQGFANIVLQSGSCIQLAPDTEFRFEDMTPIWVVLGGRQNNPLAAYVDVGCELPNANWDLFEADVEAPFTFEVAGAGVTLAMEIDSEGRVTRCDFPSCLFEGEPPGEGLAPQ